MPENLIVTAWMGTPIAVLDDWSPDLPSLLEWLILDRHGLASPNPTMQEVEATRAIVQREMPLAVGRIGEEWYWRCSSPCYTYTEDTDRFRKRWAPGIDSPSPNWGKRRALVNTQSGAEKSYDLPLYLRVTTKITWFCLGEPDSLRRLLFGCAGIGKKRGIGYGQVLNWEIGPYPKDWHLFSEGKRLMRPVPIETIDAETTGYTVRDWGWRPPVRVASNRTLCALPTECVRRVPKD